MILHVYKSTDCSIVVPLHTKDKIRMYKSWDQHIKFTSMAKLTFLFPFYQPDPTSLLPLESPHPTDPNSRWWCGMLHLAPRASRFGTLLGSKKGYPSGVFRFGKNAPETGLFWGVKDGGCFFKKNQRTLFAGHVGSFLVIEDDLFNSIHANVFSNSIDIIYIYHTLIPWERVCFHVFLSLPVTTRDLCQRLTCDPATHWLHNNSPTGTKAKRFSSIWGPNEEKNKRTRLKHSMYGIYHQNCPNLCLGTKQGNPGITHMFCAIPL